MGFLDRLRAVFRGTDQVTYYSYHGPEPSAILGMTPSQVFREQPYLRTVVTFMARNIAQLGLHVFERVGETDRKRVRGTPLTELIKRPNDQTTTAELVYGIVSDLGLYDTCYVVFSRSNRSPSGYELVRIPPPWVEPRGGTAWSYGTFRVQAPGAMEWIDVRADDMIVFHGWSPVSLRDGATPVDALKSILAEQVQAMRYREKLWQRGGKVSAILKRPPGHRWTDAQRDAFRADWQSKYTGDGTQVGGTPILEDGMSLEKIDFSAHDQQFVDGAKLALNTVCAVYHINPAMIGFTENANYSSTREFRKMLYGDTLGPLITQVEDRLNAFLVPRVEQDQDVYVEFNIQEKLQGNFEEQTEALQSAIGRPYMTTNEGRARLNLPAIDGGDDLVTPLNVMIGGQASPRDGETSGQGGGSVEDLPVEQPAAANGISKIKFGDLDLARWRT